MMVAVWLLGAALGATAAQAQHDHPADTRTRPVTLDAGLAGVHHPIQTTSPEAQKYFDQGLTLVYAFNHEEAVRSFARPPSSIRRRRCRSGESRSRSDRTSIRTSIPIVKRRRTKRCNAP